MRFCDSNEIYVATPSCDSEIFVVFCRTARTVLLILFCISDLKSQPLCDLVVICNCDFLRFSSALQRLWDLRFEIAAICDCDCTHTKVTHGLVGFLAHVSQSISLKVFLTLDN